MSQAEKGRGGPRRACRRVFFGLRVFLALLLALYLLRRPLFEGWITQELGQVLGSLLDAEVSVDSIEGNWITSLVADGIQIQGSDSCPVLDLRQGRVELQLSLPFLLQADPRCLRSAVLKAKKLGLALGRLEGSKDPNQQSQGPLDLDKYLAVAEDGLVVEVGELLLRDGDKSHSAPFELSVQAWSGTGPRRLRLRHGESSLESSLRGSGGDGKSPSLELEAIIRDPGEILRATGLGNDLRGGRLLASLRAQASPMELGVEFRLLGARHGESEVAEAGGELRLQGEALHLPLLFLNLPGIRLSGQDLTLPLSEKGLVDLKQQLQRGLEGRLSLEITDLGPHLRYLPEDLRQLMPVRGQLEARMGKGVLRIQKSQLQSAGITLQISEGLLSLGAAPGEVRSGQIHFDLSMPEARSFSIPALGESKVGGHIAGSISGSLENPALETTVDLHDLDLYGYRLESLAADVSWKEQRLALSELKAVDLRQEGCTAKQQLQGQISLLFPKEEARGYRLAANLTGNLDPGWLSLAGVEEDLIMRLSGSKAHIEGEVLLEAGQNPTGTVSVRLEGISLDQRGALLLDAKATLQEDGTIGLAPLFLTGIGEVTATGSFHPRGDLDLELGLAPLDLGALSALLRLEGTEGLVGEIQDSSIRIQGTAKNPQVTLACRASLSQIPPGLFAESYREQLPGPPVQLSLEASIKDRRLDLAELSLGWGSQQGRWFSIQAWGPLPICLTEENKLAVVEGKEQGTLSGILAARSPADPKLDLASEFKIDAKGVKLAEFEARSLGGVLAAKDLALDWKLAELLGGAVNEAGWKDWALGGTLELESFELESLPGEFFPGLKIQGLAQGHVELQGTLGRPNPQGSFELSRGSIQKEGAPGIQDLLISADLAPQTVELTKCTAKVGTHELSITASLSTKAIPLWEVLEKKDARFQANVEVRHLPLAILPPEWTGAADLKGLIHGHCEFDGSLDEPRAKLQLELTDATLKYGTTPRLEDLTAKLEVLDNRATLLAEATMGAAPITIGAKLDPGTVSIWKLPLDSQIELNAKGENVMFMRSRGLKVRGNLDLHAEGTPKDIKVGGDVTLTSGKYINRLSLLPDPRTRTGAASGNTFGPFGIEGRAGEILHFDVALKTANPFLVRTNVVDTDVNLALKLTGPGSAMHLEGTCSSSKGRIRFPGSSMQIENLRLSFSQERPGIPDLLASAAGQRHGFRIRMNLKGPFDNPQISLSSAPALQPKELWALVTTGQRPASLAQGGLRGSAALVGSYVLQEVVFSYLSSSSTEEEESFFSRFDLEFGREISRNGQETWQAEFDMSNLGAVPQGFGVRLERDVYEDHNMGLVYRWRF